MNLFNPTKDQVREFFCATWHKQVSNGILTPLESIAARWMVEHPEYHELLSELEAAKEKEFSVENGQTNPFLHLSMHLSLTEMVQVDQPKGINAISKELTIKLDSEHTAQHQMMECLGQILWESQRNGTQPDMQAYLLLLQRLL